MIFRFYNSLNTINVTVKTSLLNLEDDNFTVMDIIGLTDDETIMGLDISKKTYTMVEFKALATSTGLALDLLSTEASVADTSLVLEQVALALTNRGYLSRNAVNGSSKSYQIKNIGGVKPFTFAVSNGQLPNGLSLDSSTGEITGTIDVSAGQTFTFEVTVEDSSTSLLSVQGEYKILVIKY